jgi:hypothetical protein
LSSIIATFVDQASSIDDLCVQVLHSWIRLTSTRQGDWRTFLKNFVASVQDLTGSRGELWEAEDDSIVALRNEVETLQAQVERLTGEVRLGSALMKSHIVDDVLRAYNYEKFSVSRKLSLQPSRQ